MSAIGALRRRLRIEAPQRSPDGGGGAVVDWQLVAEVWARIAPVSGRERAYAEQIAAEVSHRITIRYRGDVEPRMRLCADDRVFAIEAVFDPDERRRRLVCLAREQLAP